MKTINRYIENDILNLIYKINPVTNKKYTLLDISKLCNCGLSTVKSTKKRYKIYFERLEQLEKLEKNKLEKIKKALNDKFYTDFITNMNYIEQIIYFLKVDIETIILISKKYNISKDRIKINKKYIKLQ